jgi:hypothetical protein
MLGEETGFFTESKYDSPTTSCTVFSHVEAGWKQAYVSFGGNKKEHASFLNVKGQNQPYYQSESEEQHLSLPPPFPYRPAAACALQKQLFLS